MDAVDRRGWVHIRSTSDRIELWVNPVSAQQRTVQMAVEILRGTTGDRRLIVKVHDRRSCGTLLAESAEQLPELIRDAVRLTSRPGHPLMQDRLVGCLPTDINDRHVRDMWRFLVATRFDPSTELVDRVVSTPGRAKVVAVDAHGGGIRYLAHDRLTAAIWKRPAGFAGRLIDDVPMPAALRRSIRADLAGMLQERQIVVSFVRGLRRVMADDAPMDSFFRVSIPLRRTAGSPQRSAVVLLAPYA